MSINILWMLHVIILTSTHCLPFRYNWNKGTPGGHCISQNAYLLSIAAWGLVIDVAITVLPMPMIWNLHLSTQRKIELSIIIGLWALDMFISIFRIVTVLQLDESDLSYSGVSTALWAVAEPSVAILVACLPVYRTLLDSPSLMGSFPRFKSRLSASRSSGNASNEPRLLSTQPAHGRSRYGALRLEEYEMHDNHSDPLQS